jgi:preprotein translocase subunit SecD
MKTILFNIFLLSFFPIIAFSQSDNNGVYLEFEEKGCSYKKVRLLNTKKFVCISDKPVISIDDYDKISKIEFDTVSNMRKFEITLSEKGSEKLVAISKLYAGKNLAFVVDDEVMCLMKVPGVISNGKITVTEDPRHSFLHKTHRNVKSSIALKDTAK